MEIYTRIQFERGLFSLFTYQRERNVTFFSFPFNWPRPLIIADEDKKKTKVSM